MVAEENSRAEKCCKYWVLEIPIFLENCLFVPPQVCKASFARWSLCLARNEMGSRKNGPISSSSLCMALDYDRTLKKCSSGIWLSRNLETAFLGGSDKKVGDENFVAEKPRRY